jgi:NAD(P)-dependent dehydrogenase (short-subunit alcohol dehydrogenase family)
MGREMILAFAQSGADVVIASRNGEACQAVAAEVTQTTGRQALAVACHVGRWNELDALVEKAYDHFGHIDVLVNNAGMSPLYDKASDVTEELWHKVIDVNLSGPFRLTALVGERMAAGGGGSIINVSSIASQAPAANVIPYAAAKAGLDAMTVAFARGLGPTVRVNSILPGTFLTDISKAWDWERFERDARSFALQRGAEPSEIIGTALYLASQASSYTTGAVIRVDGGYLQPPR